MKKKVVLIFFHFFFKTYICKNKMKEIEMIATFFIFIWCSFSLGTPLLLSLYIQQLGKCVGLISLGESGGILKNSERLVVDEFSDKFIKDMEVCEVLPFFVLLGPWAIPFSVFFGVSASMNFLVYFVRHHSMCSNLCFTNLSLADELQAPPVPNQSV